jgi:hypothetical protein
MEVAADFHQLEAFEWLFRDATVFERELLGVFALEQKLADMLEVALENVYRPWWDETREWALKWRASGVLNFGTSPEGFSAEGGWWTDVSGVVWALPALGCGAVCNGNRRPGSELEGTGEWTKALSEALLGGRTQTRSIVFPAGVTAIGDGALKGFEHLESVAFPASCTAFGHSGLVGCRNLQTL